MDDLSSSRFERRCVYIFLPFLNRGAPLSLAKSDVRDEKASSRWLTPLKLILMCVLLLVLAVRFRLALGVAALTLQVEFSFEDRRVRLV